MKQQRETPNRHYLDGRRQAAARLQKIRGDVTRLSSEDRQIIRSGLGYPDTPMKRGWGIGRSVYCTEADVQTYKGWDTALDEFFGVTRQCKRA